MINKNELKQLIAYSKTLKVLYVEDTKEAREQALKLLENFFTDITVAINGQDGFDKFLADRFDLIFSDLNMPVMSGIDMIKNIRFKDNDIPIVIISAHNELIYQINSDKYNILDYMTKPTNFNKFIEILIKLKNK